MPLSPDKIRKRRDKLGLSQQTAADRAGITQPSWARIETGLRTDPRLSTAEQVAKALKVGLEQLLKK